jgi:hypothetical protein
MPLSSALQRTALSTVLSFAAAAAIVAFPPTGGTSPRVAQAASHPGVSAVTMRRLALPSWRGRKSASIGSPIAGGRWQETR